MARVWGLVRWRGWGAWLLALALGGCGFELRGTTTLPEGIGPLFIEGGGPTVKILQQSLVASGQELAPTAAAAKGVIRILQERPSTRVLSVNKQGKVIAYELRYQVRFSATSTVGKEPIAPQGLDLVRDYVNPDTEVLGKQLEADMIFNDLRQDAARQILQRVASQWR